MLIIDREFRRRERGVGKVGREWAVGEKARPWEEQGTEQGIRCRRAEATSQTWQAPHQTGWPPMAFYAGPSSKANGVLETGFCPKNHVFCLAFGLAVSGC